MSGNGHNQLPNLPATCYTVETPPRSILQGTVAPGQASVGAGV